MNRRLRVARWGASIAAAGFAALAIGAAVPPAAVATPEEDCQAVRDRDHRIWLDLIANLPPGAPIPPEPINPCIGPGPETPTTATPLPGQPGQTGQAGPGLQVGANAPTLMPRYNGTDIVPVPGLPVPPPQTRGGNPADQRESGASTAPNTIVPGSRAPTTSSAPPADQTPSSTPAAPVQADQVSGEHRPDPSATADKSGGDSNVIELLLVAGAALAAAAGMRRPRSASTPEAVLSQVVGTVAEPLTALSPGGHLVVEVPKPDGGHITYVLMNDPDSPTDHAMSTTAPPGGRLEINPDGTVSIIDATGAIIGTVAPAWAYDKTGAPVPTWYEIRNGRLYQIIRPGPDTRWPVLGDDNTTAGKGTDKPTKQTKGGNSGGGVAATPDTMANVLLDVETDNPVPPTALQGPDDIPSGTALAEIRDAGQQDQGVPATPDSWGNALAGTETDNPVPPTALQGPDDIPSGTALAEIRDAGQQDQGVPVTPDSWGNALVGTETDNPAPPTALQGPDDIPSDSALGALRQLAEFQEQVIEENAADGGIAPEVGTLGDSLKRAAGVLAVGAIGTSETGVGLPAAAALAVGAGALLLVGMALDRGDGRDVFGRYADGNDGRSGKEAEKAALDEEEAIEGIRIERDQVKARVEGATQGRYYDGLSKNPDGTYTGYEVKSNTAGKNAKQREFDDLVSPDNPARATLHGKPIEITEVVDLKW